MLSKRLRQVAALTALGFSREAIGITLRMSQHAVHAAFTRIHRVLGFESSLRLAIFIVRHPEIEKMLRASLGSELANKPN
jgi:DNA-binding NarL/FixJ family response regulator